MALLNHLLCKLWQRRIVECDVKGFEEKSGKEGWVSSEDWLAWDEKRLGATSGPENRGSVPGELRRLFSGGSGLEKVVAERRRQAGLLLDEAGAVQPT